MQALEAYPFPGNVRELQNAVERGAVLARGSEVQVEDLMLAPAAPSLAQPEKRAGAEATSGQPGSAAFPTLTEHLEHATREHVADALTRTAGAKHEADRLLGIERTTLYRLLKRGEEG